MVTLRRSLQSLAATCRRGSHRRLPAHGKLGHLILHAPEVFIAVWCREVVQAPAPSSLTPRLLRWSAKTHSIYQRLTGAAGYGSGLEPDRVCGRRLVRKVRATK